MKKVFLVLFAFAMTVVVNAQIQFGIKAGYNLTNLSLSPSDPGIKSKSDFSAGAFVSVPVFSSCYLQPELLYSGQGAAFSDSFATGKLNYGYLNIPILFKYQHSSGLFAETGPQIGFLLNAKDVVNGQSVDAKAESQSTDFSWAFGLGYQFTGMGLGVDARYNLGLTNINKDSNTGTVKNSVFQFGLFLCLGTKISIIRPAVLYNLGLVILFQVFGIRQRVLQLSLLPGL